MLILLAALGSRATAEPLGKRATEDRPLWHFTALPEEGHCLPYDPNGAIFWKGKYHLMYIFQDPRRPSEGHCWGHASSVDLVNWTFHPPALVPEPGDPDVGIYSGNAFVNHEGKPMLCWCGIRAGVCIATAEDDDLIRWKKHPNNPVIPIPKQGQPESEVYKVWDPYLWREGDTYYCLLGGQNYLPNGKDTLYLCKSSDLVHWTPLHPFYEHMDLSWTKPGEDCSCPDFFKLGDKHVLMCLSHTVGGRCYVGRYEHERFYPEQHVRMNWPGGTFFAPESLEDNQGRRIFWAWIMDPRLYDTKNATGSGAMTLPRVLSLDAEGTLQIVPATELEALRRNPRTIEKIVLESDTEVELPHIRGNSLELLLEIDPRQAREVGLKVCCSPDGKEETAVFYQAATKTLILDMSRSTLRTDVVYCEQPTDMAFRKQPRMGDHPCSLIHAPLAIASGETLTLRVFLDQPVLEVFVNNRQCLTQMIFPQSRDATAVKVFARGGVATLDGGKAWDMAPAQFVNEKNKMH